MDLENAPKKLSTYARSTKPKCRGTSRQTGKPCGKFPLPGKTLCKFHGGPSEKVSATHLVTHGLKRQYFHADELPALLEQIETLKTKQGRQAILMRGAALTEQRASKVPDDVEFIDAYVKARGSIRGDIALLENMEAEEQAPQLPVFNIAIGDATQHAPFEARTLEGHCTVRMLDGKPFLLDAATGGWMPAQLRKDEDSGAEFYERVLVAIGDGA
jgi:hypothetical protein